MDVGRSQTKLAGARLQQDALRAVDFLELLGNVLRAIGGAIVDDDNLPVEVAAKPSGERAKAYVAGVKHTSR